ncbi:LysR family transcriptional regulator [Lacisediminihabitans changchengi]|uniref:LysR family transcriptional regulator n=1 Tax=Lacisediminihabitans changchengi TaxID=2787634 RepID=A0A934STU8_9MICO|nr:LysR family transcriptional regulator [Lacisediminihabitans changchengi]MBK4348830.1 LysR family transcriptional regulator [Lacisediminihabitans changchengi]
MDTKWIITFVELADRGTLRAVAEASGYSTSAVSQQLASLQRELSATLVGSSGRRLKLTPEGRAFLPRARQILAALDGARGDLQDDGQQATIVVAAYAISLIRHVLPATRILRERLPGLVVQVEEREPPEVRDLLARDLIDIGIVYDYSLVPADHSGEHFDAVPVMLAVHPSNRGTAAEIFADAASDWIVNPRTADDEELLRRVAAHYDAVPSIHHRIDSIELASECIASGFGVALLPEDARPHPGVRYLPLDGAAGDRRSFVVTRPGRQSWPSYEVVTSGILEAARSGRPAT